MALRDFLARAAFTAAVILGRPFGGLRPRRIYRWLAHAGFRKPAPKWITTGLGLRMKLCPFYQLDREIIFSGRYDQPLHAFFERVVRHGMVCVDAGANIGDSTLHLAQLVGPSGHVFAFEPAPFPRARLIDHVAANDFGGRVSISESALADRQGTAIFSFGETAVENQGMGSLVSHDNDVVTCKLEVPLQPLDRFVIDSSIETIDLIKVDIQGAEPLFLKGAEMTIRQYRPIICMELSPPDLAAYETDVPSLIGMIEAMDYVVHTLTPEGMKGRAIASATLTREYRASNVICTPIGETGGRRIPQGNRIFLTGEKYRSE